MPDETLTVMNAAEVRDVRLERYAAGVWNEVAREWKEDAYAAAWAALTAQIGLQQPELVEAIAEACAMDNPPVQVQELTDYLKTRECGRRMLLDGVA